MQNDRDVPAPAASAREPLKPCPFCGRSDRLSADACATERSASIYCGGCATLGPSAWGHEDNVAFAIAAWNARPAPAEPPAGVGFLVGDLVTGTRAVLASGCGRYDAAIVVNQSPLVLVSRDGDMRWSCDLEDYGLVKIGKAPKKELRAAIHRVLDSGLFDDITPKERPDE